MEEPQFAMVDSEVYDRDLTSPERGTLWTWYVIEWATNKVLMEQLPQRPYCRQRQGEECE